MNENFELKRQGMMKELSKRRRDNVVKRKISNMQKSSSETVTAFSVVTKKKIAVYGADSFFLKNFINTLKLTNDVTYDKDIEKLMEYIMDSGINNVFIDLDEPTDWKKSVDIFTSIKTINPEAQFYICTKDPEWVQAQILEKQGGIVLKKPVDFDQFSKSLK